MSDKIKPSEVSEVLQQQLQEVNSSEKFDEVGTVLTVSDGVARIYGLRNAEANELLEFENGTMAIVMNLEEDNVGCVLLGPTAGIKEGQSVKRTHRIASIRVNDNFLGRVVNPLGQAIDSLGEQTVHQITIILSLVCLIIRSQTQFYQFMVGYIIESG